MSLRPSGSDALGRRVSAYGQNFYYSKNWQVIQDSSSITLRQYVWSLAYVDAMVLRDFNQDGNMGTGNWGKAGSGLDLRLYPMQDANWNVTGLVWLNGTTPQVMERYVYDPYGKFTCYDSNWALTVTPQTPRWAWAYLHQGGRWDTAAGLYHFRNRDFSPTLGRWMTEDPKRYVDGGSLYEAYRSSPVGAVDPMGLAVELQGHRVAGNSWHLSLKITLGKQSRWAADGRFTGTNPDGSRYLTLGAGPGSWLNKNRLVSDVNRTQDTATAGDLDAVRRRLAQPNCYNSEDDWISDLMRLDSGYGDKLNYGFPGTNRDDEYNSNGYVSGILDATGTSRPAGLDELNDFLRAGTGHGWKTDPRFDMYDHPVPVGEFPLRRATR